MQIENVTLDLLNKYFAIATLLMPAIIMITIRRWITPINCNFFQDVYKFVGYSMFNFLIFGFITKVLNWNLFNDVFNLVFIKQHPAHFIWFAILLPIILGLCLAGIDRLNLMNYILKLIFKKNIETNGLTAWEEFFSQNPSGNINVTLSNGTQIIGYFDSFSMVSSSIEYKDIYINRVESIGSHSFEKPISIWIPIKDIQYILIENSNDNQIAIPSTRLLIVQNSQSICNLSDEINELKREILMLRKNISQGGIDE